MSGSPGAAAGLSEIEQIGQFPLFPQRKSTKDPMAIRFPALAAGGPAGRR
jgi:hypothetical protein